MTTFAPIDGREKPLKFFISGQSGSGKTYACLILAECYQRLSEDPANFKIALVDTEGGALMSQAQSFFLPNTGYSIQINPDEFSYDAMANLMQEALNNDFKLFIVDSLSPAWAGKSGVFGSAIAKAKDGNVTLAAHKTITGKQNQAMAKIENFPLPFFCTVKEVDSVKVTEGTKNDGRSVPVIEKVYDKLVQKTGTNFFFDVVLKAHNTIWTPQKNSSYFNRKDVEQMASKENLNPEVFLHKYNFIAQRHLLETVKNRLFDDRADGWYFKMDKYIAIEFNLRSTKRNISEQLRELMRQEEGSKQNGRVIGVFADEAKALLNAPDTTALEKKIISYYWNI